MPKKKHPETPEEQAKRFKAEVARLIAAGELDPDEAERALQNLVASQAPRRKAS
jgi:hypothetical protein